MARLLTIRWRRSVSWLHAAVLVCAVSASAFSPREARAQVAVGRTENPEADKFVTRGIELRAEGKDAAALRAFEKAAEIDPDSARVQIHLATVHQALGNWLLADEYLSLALSRQNHAYVDRHRKSLEDAQRVIHANIGRLEVEGQPIGAEVRLNGRLVGTLPLTEPVRATVGSYVLEVGADGHYTSKRPIVITGGGLVREAVHLEPLAAEARTGTTTARPHGGERVGNDRADRPVQPWLTWTLVGASGVAAVTTIGAVVLREVHAGRWNDNDRCLEVDRTREEVCGSERDKVKAAETVAWVGGALTGLFAAGALLNNFAFVESAPNEAGLVGCALGFGNATCFGSF